MSVFAYDIEGYLGDVASVRGWSEALGVLASSGAAPLSLFAERAYTKDPRFLAQSIDAMLARGYAEWDESKHPRDEDGQFTSGQSSLLQEIPAYKDAFGEKETDSHHAKFRKELWDRQAHSVRSYLSGDKPVASYTHGEYTSVTMTDGSKLFLKKDDPYPAPSGQWQGWWDTDLQEVSGLSKADYNKLPYAGRALADAKVQAIKYAPKEFDNAKEDFWGQSKKNYDQDDEGHEGKWVTVRGRAIFIRKDESMESALTRSLLKKGKERPKADEEDKTLSGLLAGNVSRLKGEQKKKGLLGKWFEEEAEVKKVRPRIKVRGES